MKRYLSLLLICTAFLSVLSCTNSEGEPDVTAQEEAFEKLAGQWGFGSNNEGSIFIDGVDATLNYSGFSLSFTDGTYQTQNAGSLLNASGTWEWLDEDARQLQVDSGEVITLNELTETRLRFSFTSDGNVAAGSAGNYIITLVK